MLELAVLCDVGGALATATCALEDETPLLEKVRVLEPSERVRGMLMPWMYVCVRRLVSIFCSEEAAQVLSICSFICRCRRC